MGNRGLLQLNRVRRSHVDAAAHTHHPRVVTHSQRSPFSFQRQQVDADIDAVSRSPRTNTASTLTRPELLTQHLQPAPGWSCGSSGTSSSCPSAATEPPSVHLDPHCRLYTQIKTKTSELIKVCCQCEVEPQGSYCRERLSLTNAL